MPHIVVGTAGHIDHGKSTLVRALTGVDPDRLTEEKARGITIDLGFASWRQGDVTVAFVDVPGHERFVRNMLAGAGGIDAVLLVVAADEGVMPQTREHFEICRLLGVRAGVIAVTKVDAVERGMTELAALDVAELVKGSALATAPIVPVSGRTGEGLDRLREELLALAAHGTARAADGPVRLPVDRVFSMRGFGTVVTGTLDSGTLTVEQELDVVPGGRRVKVRGLQVHNAATRAATAGSRVAVNLAGVDVDEIARGVVLASPGTLPVTQLVDASLQLLPGTRPLRHNARVRFHQGTAEVLARVSLVAPAAPGDGPVEQQPGSTGYVRLRLESPAPVARGDRFVLRAYSPAVTIGGGRVLDPTPPRAGVRSPATRARLAALDAPFGDERSQEVDALLVFVRESGPAGLSLEELRARAGAARAGHAIAGLQRRGDVWTAGGRLLLREWQEALATRVERALEAHHRAEPLSEGLPREEVRERVLGDASPPVADAVLEGLLQANRIQGRDRLRLPGHEVRLSGEEAAAEEALLSAYRAGGLTPPDPSALPAATGLPAAVVHRVTQLLLRRKRLVKLDTLIFHPDALSQLKDEIAAMKAAGGRVEVNVATFKGRYGLTRKYAIPLLEYLDRERITRREGESRIVL
ncbi:MAG TPA: selenocysteine-specific translation elongation factor [Vicinamibacterales bacterium]